MHVPDIIVNILLFLLRTQYLTGKFCDSIQSYTVICNKIFPENSNLVIRMFNCLPILKGGFVLMKVQNFEIVMKWYMISLKFTGNFKILCIKLDKNLEFYSLSDLSMLSW